MSEMVAQAGRLLLMIVFLCGSAYCSGAETAFFALTRRQINGFKQSKHRLERLVGTVMDSPSDLLGSLLLGNLIVNVLFFALSSVLMLKVEQQAGALMAAVTAFVTFLCLVLFGEILPKSLSYANPKRFSLWVVLPTMVLVKVLTPVVTFFRWIMAEPVLRIFLGNKRHPDSVTGGEFKALIEGTLARGLITPHQGRLFTEVIDFNLLRVRHVMRPRVDMVACDLTDPLDRAKGLMLDHCATTLFVYNGTLDAILGEVEFRELLLDPEASLQSLMRPVQYIPEQQTIEKLLQYFRKMRIDTAVVVDEYGGVAGSVCVEDVAGELFGSLQTDEDIKEIEKIGPFKYRLAGGLPIHDWAKTFGADPDNTDVSTVGGWVTLLLGHIPKPGNSVQWNNITFTVETMRRHRVQSILMSVEPHDD
ncbi:MAG: hemolysin family protein [Phycisphaerae bacterium]|nr:hemolysin family protein [Phycisphaerae bacterium]